MIKMLMTTQKAFKAKKKIMAKKCKQMKDKLSTLKRKKKQIETKFSCFLP